MKRTTTRRQREMKHFITDNRRLFPFVLLFVAGVGVGVAVTAASAGSSLALQPPETPTTRITTRQTMAATMVKMRVLLVFMFKYLEICQN